MKEHEKENGHRQPEYRPQNGRSPTRRTSQVKQQSKQDGCVADPYAAESQLFQLDMADYEDTNKSQFHRYKLSILCAFFGLGTWLPVNALYSQMPLLVHYAPEHWSLPSYLIVIVQIANVVPAVYSYFRRKLEKVTNSLISIFLLIGTMSLLLSSFFYDITFEVFQYEHSVCFFIITLLCSSVGCISSVLFLPFMNALPEQYLVSYFTGVSCSGLIPSLLALMQGVKRTSCKSTNVTQSDVKITSGAEAEPLFDPRMFFLMSSSLMLLSTMSFSYLKKYSEAHSEQDKETIVFVRETNKKIGRKLYLSLMILQVVVNCFQHGILMSIQSYSCLRYGVGAYHWSVNLNQMIGPLAVYISSYLPLHSLQLLAMACFFLTACIGYEMTTALMSQPPPFVQYGSFGSVHIVLVWMLGSGFTSFVKLSTVSILRRHNAKALFYFGAMTQIGSACGALISFILINYTNLFHSNASKTC